MKKLSLYLYLILLFFTGIAYADLNSGEAAFHRGDYQTAINELTPLAENGDAKAQYFLGAAYFKTKNIKEGYYWSQLSADAGIIGAKINVAIANMNGWVENPDYGKAFRILQPLAQQGNKYAQAGLGDIYFWGRGVKADYLKAVYWYKKSLTHSGEKPLIALNNLAVIYANGYLGKSDHKQAIHYYTIAAQEGLYEAMHKLGFIYELGTNDGIKPDYVQAYKWLYLAIYQGYKADQPALEILSKKMTAEQIKSGTALAQAFIKKYQKNLIKARHQTSIILNY